MKRIIAAAGLGALVALVGAVPAQADPISPAPGHVARTWHGTPWEAPAPASPTPAPVRTWTPPAQTRAPLWVRIVPGNTLWGLATTYLGSGYEWPTIAALNGITGTTIYAGTLLRVR